MCSLTTVFSWIPAAGFRNRVLLGGCDIPSTFGPFSVEEAATTL